VFVPQTSLLPENSSLFCSTVIVEEKSIISLTPVVNVIKLFVTDSWQNKLECLSLKNLCHLDTLAYFA